MSAALTAVSATVAATVAATATAATPAAAADRGPWSVGDTLDHVLRAAWGRLARTVWSASSSSAASAAAAAASADGASSATAASAAAKSMLSMSSVVSSAFFLVAGVTLVLVRRISSIAQPIQPRRLRFLPRLLLRLPVTLAAVMLMFSFARLYALDELPENSDLTFLLFFVLHCFDFVVSSFISVLETGRARHDEHQGEPPNVIEWGAALYFNADKLTSANSPVIVMIAIQLVQIVLTNTIGIVDSVHKHRLIPSMLVGLVNIAHAFYWTMLLQRPGYPAIFWIARIPEMLLVLYFGILGTAYVASRLVLGDNMRTDPDLWSGVSLRDDFNMALRKWATASAKTVSSVESGYSRELEPIFAPAGIGLPPSILMDAVEPPTGFRLNLDELEIRKDKSTVWSRILDSARNDDVAEGPYRVMTMYSQSFGAVGSSLQIGAARAMKWFGMDLASRRRNSRSGRESDVDEDDVGDDDYRPEWEDANGLERHAAFDGAEQWGHGHGAVGHYAASPAADNDDDDASSVSTTRSDCDDDEYAEDDEQEQDEMYKEVFWLAKDLQTPVSETPHVVLPGNTTPMKQGARRRSSARDVGSPASPGGLFALAPVLQQAQAEDRVLTRRQRRLMGIPLSSLADALFVGGGGGSGIPGSPLGRSPTSPPRSAPASPSMSQSFSGEHAAQYMDDEGDGPSADFSTRPCVVCHLEPRSIVLRPCGCLCLCDTGCREALALRDYKECPCCRRPVKGYQKIFQP
ncbi:hypothetical protein BC831DRAFT_440583 [Entophlyctis helioformis]|nr:hypothetical protein BC831DRAFT_440583 [Entophlyctis helioformis]